jgi:Rad3-related DNA helicase
MILGFFFEEGKSYSFDYRMALIKRIDRGTKKKKMNQKAKTKVSKDLVVDPSEWNYKLCFWCLNPGAIFRQLTDDTHSVILTSGTLSPVRIYFIYIYI